MYFYLKQHKLLWFSACLMTNLKLTYHKLSWLKSPSCPLKPLSWGVFFWGLRTNIEDRLKISLLNVYFNKVHVAKIRNICELPYIFRCGALFVYTIYSSSKPCLDTIPTLITSRKFLEFTKGIDCLVQVETLQ